MAIILINIV